MTSTKCAVPSLKVAVSASNENVKRIGKRKKLILSCCNAKIYRGEECSCIQMTKNESQYYENCVLGKKSDKKTAIWYHIISELKIDLTQNVSVITAANIKECKKTWLGKSDQFEPRILCKMDRACDRPQIFIDNGISILSIKNGTYALIKENIYFKLSKYHCVPVVVKNKTDSLVLDIGDSETSMLDKLYYNGIFSDVIGEPIKYGPLLGGRHRCSFNTVIGETPIDIVGSQYETDGCYETENTVCVVEAKSVYCNDFNLRQLYYPVREIYKKVGNKKTIMALFICKDKKGIIHIHKFKWNDYAKMLDVVNIGYFQYIL